MNRNPFVKICGITSVSDAEMVCAYSPDYLGFIFHSSSPRNIEISILQKISEYVRKKYLEKIRLIGVFVNPSIADINARSEFIDGFQLHGNESPQFCEEVQKKFPNHVVWKAFRIKNKKDIAHLSQYTSVSTLLVDAFSDKKNEYGGSGKTINGEVLSMVRLYMRDSQQLIVAGGITSHNKNNIIKISNADGIDLSSGVEISAGKKSNKKIKEFFMSS